jgi:hypothetical protein
MDPLTIVALAEMFKAGFEMVTEIVKGQPPEIKAKQWEQWQADQERWRKLFKLD